MKRKNLKKPMISALEQRILFDGAAVATAVDVLDNSSFTPTNDSTTTNDMTNNNAENSVHEAQAVQGFEKSRKEVAFVDVTVKDYQTLVDGVGEGVETYLVSSLDEIKSILENETNIDAIHILSHGETGEITVGNDVLNKDTLQNFDAVLQSMKTSLTGNGDILLYGCNVANDGSGEEFITELATITEADVAASDDLTGSSALGGDWVLEVNTGSIEASSLVASNYVGTLDSDANGNFNFGTASGSAGTSTYLYSNLAGSGTGTITIVAHDVDYSQGERNHVYFKDANDTTWRSLGYLKGSNNADSTTVFSNVSFDTGGQATIRIYGEVSGWVYQIKSSNFTTSGNAAPEFTSGTSATVAEDGSVNITVSGKDGMTLNDNVTLSLHSGPSHGTISGFATQSGSPTASDTFTYTPSADYNGSDSITFKLTDGIDTVYRTININVTAVADIANDSISVNEDSSVTYNLLSNDSFEGNDSISSVTQGAYGNVTIVNASTGEVRYTPRTANWHGSDSFTYTVLSGGKYETATVNVTVNSVNDAPTVTNNANLKLQSINEDVASEDNKGSRIDSLFDPVFNDVDSPDSLSSVEVVSINADSATQGVYEFSSDNGASWSTVTVGAILNDTYKIRFTPVANYFGTPGTITVKLRDQGNGIGGVLASSGTATLSVQVNSVNDIPVITSALGAATITETSADDVPSSLTPSSGSLTGTLSGTDVEDDISTTPLNFSIQGGTLSGNTYTLQGKYGVLSLDTTTNDWTYTPNKQEALNALATGDTDTDEFMFKIIDSEGAQANQSLVITLIGENDLPEVSQTISDQTFSGNGNWIYQIPANTFLDREGNGLTYTVQQVDSNGVLVGDGSLPTGVTFDEATRSFLGDKDTIIDGNFYLKVTATDHEGASATDIFQVTFADVENNAPVVENPIDRVAIDLATAGTAGTFYTIPENTFSDDIQNSTDLIYTTSILPAGMSFNSATREFSSDGNLATGKYIIDVTATDLGADGLVNGDDKSATTQFVIYVDDGNPSTISADQTIPDQIWNGSGGHTFKIPSNAFTFDDAGDTVTYSATADGNPLPSWLTLDPTTGVLSGNPPHDAAAIYAIVITATETTGLEIATSGFNLTIGTPNDAPILNSTVVAQDQLVTEEQNFSYNFGDLFIDPDGNADGSATTSTLTYSAEVWDGTAWIVAPSWLAITDTTISGTPIGNVPFLDIKLIATDSGGATNETTFKLDLQDPTSTSSVGAYTANNPGIVTVGGTPTEGQTLSVTSVTDPDGNPSGGITYQWQVSSDNGTTWTDISNATNVNYTLTNNEAGKQVRAKVFYTDGGDVAETQESDALSIANVDDTGNVSLSGTWASGDVVVATINDSDGLVGVEPTYTWYRGNSNTGPWTQISGATGSSYTLTNDDGNKYIKVVASYTDNQGSLNNPESVSPTTVQLGAVAPVAVNDTASVTEGGGLNNETAGGAISGNLFTNDTDLNPGDTKTLVEVRVGSLEGAGSGVVSGVDDGDGNIIYTITGSYGTLTINEATGAYTYTLDETNSDVEALNEGDSLTESFNYAIKDSTNRNDIAVLNITINGANDSLVVTTDVNSASLVEAGGVDNDNPNINTASITFTAVDVDNTVSFDTTYLTDLREDVYDNNTQTTTSEQVWFLEGTQVSRTTEYGGVFFDTTTGVMTYYISNGIPALQALRPGESVTENVSIKVISGTEEIIKTVSFVIEGSNDTPTITIVDVIGTLVEAETLSDNGSITFIDVDFEHTPIGTEATKSVTALAQDGTTALVLTAQQQSDIENAFSITNVNTNTNNGTVTWDYTITEGKLDFLGAGEVVTAIFTITVTDNVNATATQDVTVTITGTNDTPTITVIDDNGAIVEGTKLGDNGSISFADLDLTDRPTATEVTSSVTAIAQNGSVPLTLTAQQQSDIENAFNITNVNTNTNDGTITWDYTITENQLDFLGEGEVVTAVFTITVTDDEGATATQNITVTITGTNDAPTISIIDETAEIVEGTKLSDNGSVTFADLDLTDRPIATEATKSVSAVAQNGTTALALTTQQQSDIENAFVITNVTGNSNNGTVTWDYTITEEKINFLGQGEKVTAVFTITVTDDEGATATQNITVTITGTNDAPIIQIVDNTAEIKDKTTLSDKGSITFSDLDLTDKPLATETMKSINGSLKSGSPLVLTAEQKNNIENAFVITNVSTNTNNGTINWDYQIDQKAVEFLGEGEKVTAVFTITVTDDEKAIATQDIIVTITGTNDVPTVSAENIDTEISFGDEYTKDVSILFSDKDLTDSFIYEATNLPDGLKIDPITGIISGRVSQSGNFIIVLKVTDSSGASVSRTYNMLVVAPPQEQIVETPNTPIFDNTNNESGNTNTNDGLNNFGNTNINSNLGVINYNSFDGMITDTGIGFLTTENFQRDGLGNNLDVLNQGENNTANKVNGNSNEKGILQANVDLNVLNNGQVVFNQDNQDSFSIVGITIEDIKINNNYIDVKVVDIKSAQNFIVTQIDGTPLPNGLSYDPRTGNITGVISEDLEKLEISIKAINLDGTTRVLNLKLDLKELKQKMQAEVNEKFIGLKEQIAFENQKLDGYGSYLTKLFA